LNDWTLPPYRFEDKPAGRSPRGRRNSPPRRRLRRRRPSRRREPPPEEPFRADLKHAKGQEEGPPLDLVDPGWWSCCWPC
jgi:penicillin-binding protein 1A